MPLRILIVEDDKHTRRILESLLSKDPALADLSPEIVVTADGKDGLAAVEKQRFDLVISDLLMPRMDGFQFCRELRKHPNGTGTPLIVTSAIYKDPAALNKLQTDTGAEFFAKPFQVRELLGLVRKLIAAEREKQNPDKANAPKVLAAIKPVDAAPLPTSPAQSGKLQDRGPARLLLDFHEQRATGVLTVMRGKVRKDCILRHGTPVSVSSNLRTETLGHFLVGRGLLDETRHQQALERAQASHDRLGRVLLELGWITEKDLLHELGAQMRSKLTSVMRWADGAWSFQPQQPPSELVATPVEAPRLVFLGLQKTAHVDEIAHTLVRARGRIALTLRAERHREPFVRVFGAEGLEALQRRPLVEDVMAGAEPSAMLVQLDVLLLCGMAEIEPASAAAGEGTDPDALPVARDPFDIETTQIGAEPGSGGKADLYDELFGDDISEVRPAPSGAGKPPASFADGLDDSDDDAPSMVAEVPAAPAPARRADGDPAVEALRKEVLAEYFALHGKDHYRVLGLPRDAPFADVAAAYAELGRRFKLERFADVDLGPDYARVEEILERLREAYDVLSSRTARAAYDHTLDGAAGAPRPTPLMDAEVLAKQAENLLAAGDPAGARKKLVEVVKVAPDQADYHALLAWAVFKAESGTPHAGVPNYKAAAQAAWPHLEQALALDPDLADAHDYAGRIAAAAGDDERSLPHLERALDADPARDHALAALEAAHARKNDWRRLERQYRKLIHRLGDRDRERSLRLWWRLAELYRGRLADRDSARVALEMVARLAPDDPRPREQLARLTEGDPSAWRDTASALRDSLRIAPMDPEPGRALVKLHLDGQRWDAAWNAAAALVARGVDDAQAGELYRRYRPRFLQRAPGAIAPALVDKLRHPDDDRELGALFAQTFACWRPFTAEQLGVAESNRIERELLPEPFRRVLEYLAPLYGVEAPQVYRHVELGAEAHVAALDPPVLLAGPQALAIGDRFALGFKLGRAFTYLWPGRATAGALPARQLKIALLAAVTLVQPGLKADDADGQIAALRAQLAAAPGLVRAVTPQVEKLLKNPQGTLNLSRYTRGLARTADRFGLLVAGDLPTAARLAADGGALGAQDDLIDFALSPEYADARDAIGISVAV
ncbi:MAG TPA: response regulator [Polyangia bacterium]|nr:response regulator [Polyangia bacterium]